MFASFTFGSVGVIIFNWSRTAAPTADKSKNSAGSPHGYVTEAWTVAPEVSANDALMLTWTSVCPEASANERLTTSANHEAEEDDEESVGKILVEFSLS